MLNRRNRQFGILGLLAAISFMGVAVRLVQMAVKRSMECEVIAAIEDVGGSDFTSGSAGGIVEYVYPDIDKAFEENSSILHSQFIENWLLKNCQSEDQRLRRRCACAMGKILRHGPNAPSSNIRIALGRIRDQDPDDYVRGEAYSALSNEGN